MSLCIYFTEEFSNLKLELSQLSWLVMDWKQLITQESHRKLGDCCDLAGGRWWCLGPRGGGWTGGQRRKSLEESSVISGFLPCSSFFLTQELVHYDDIYGDGDNGKRKNQRQKSRFLSQSNLSWKCVLQNKMEIKFIREVCVDQRHNWGSYWHTDKVCIIILVCPGLSLLSC